MPEWFVLSTAAAFALVIGSFLNVVIHRLPRELSLLRPASHCPRCEARVRWYDNVPILSYIVLLGRCRDCRSPISPRYPAVELASALLVVACLKRFGLDVMGVQAVVFALLLLPLAVIDLEHYLLPDWLTYPGIVIGLGFSFSSFGLVSLRDAAIGAAVGALLPWIVLVVYKRLRGVEGMGLGDVKLLAMIGAFVGWQGALLALCLGSFLGAFVGVVMIASGRGGRETELPFGTFLAVAAVAVLFVGPQILRLLGWVAV